MLLKFPVRSEGQFSLMVVVLEAGPRTRPAFFEMSLALDGHHLLAASPTQYIMAYSRLEQGIRMHLLLRFNLGTKVIMG